ncbi:MAG TPA: choice-of-anchor tandem repeat GloVer-containing protein [Rhizomicrobium sp.]
MRHLNSTSARWLLGCGLAAALSLPFAHAQDNKKPAKNGADTVLYSFAGGPSDGSFPVAGLFEDASGNFYGTTEYGGTNDLGAVVKLATGGSESVLYSFAGGASDGAYPSSSLIADSSGNLYGTTIEGGLGNCSEDGCGTVFEISPSGTESVIYAFSGIADGAGPQAGLIQDQAGNLYGTTYAGGGSSVGTANCAGGCGTVFELSPSNGSWIETVLYSFSGVKDGAGPYSGLVMDGGGNLYGTTTLGGGSINCPGGCGAVYELSPVGNGTWKEKVIWSFKGGGGGNTPSSTLYMDSAGNLYGTTPEGGSVKCGGGCGLMFKLSPTKTGGWTEVRFRAFAAGKKGAFPLGNLIADSKGNIYGTAEGAGLYNCGVVYQMSSSGTETALHSFTGAAADGCEPLGGLLSDTSGQLYGMTADGGATSNGVIFKLPQ